MPLQLVSTVLKSSKVQPLPPWPAPPGTWFQCLIPLSQPGTPSAASLAAGAVSPAWDREVAALALHLPCRCQVTSSAKFLAGCACCSAGNVPVQCWMCGSGGSRAVDPLQGSLGGKHHREGAEGFGIEGMLQGCSPLWVSQGAAHCSHELALSLILGIWQCPCNIWLFTV